MPSDYLDYENNLAFAPKSADDLNEQKRESDVLIAALEKCEKLEQENKRLTEKVEGLETELHEVLSILLRVSPQHDEWIRLNFPDFYKKQANVWFE
jgi:hypothetical protein